MKIKLIGLAVLLLLHISCKDRATGDTDEERTKEVNIVYSNWSEGIAISFLVKNVLEDKLEYKVNLKLADIDEAYSQLASGKQDLMLNAWLPNTHQKYFEEHQQNIEQVGVVYETAITGLLVPEEAEIESIEELNNYTDTIYGIEPESGIMLQTNQAIEEYELNLVLKDSDEENMLQILDEKYKRRDSIVITGWKPHLVFSKYDLKFLEDPQNIYPKSEKIYALVNKESGSKDETLMKFLSRLNLNQKQITRLIQEIKSNPSGEDAGAKEWINQHQLVVSQWVKNLDEFEEKPM